MDVSGTLFAIAATLPALPLESLDSMLVTFDTLVGLGGDEGRANAAQFLRDAAARSAAPACQERLLLAADKVAAGVPCALTPDGLTGAQAAAANTVTMEEWNARGGDSALPPPPAAQIEEPADDDEDGEDDEPTVLMEGKLPELPDLRVRDFFPGLAVRVRRDFADAEGRPVPLGVVLRFLISDLSDQSVTLSFLERTIRLKDQAILENAGNQWFQPVPSHDCLMDLWELVDRRLSEADLDDDDPNLEFLEDVICDVSECEYWLMASGPRGPAPQCNSAPLAAEVFGRHHEMTAWIGLLFAAIAFCPTR